MKVTGPAFFRTSGITYPYLVYDTFTGGGFLSDHTGEKGTPWSGGGVTYLLGNGFVCPAASFGSDVYASQSDAFADGYVDVEFTSRYPILGGTTVLLLNFNLVTTTTNFVDSSGLNNVVTASGNAAITTGVSKYGNGSVVMGGYPDSLRVTDSGVFDFGTSDLTIEFWVYNLSFTSTVAEYISIGDGTTGNTEFRISRINSTGGGLRFQWFDNGTQIMVLNSTSVVPQNSWQHIALVRNGVQWYLYLNGVREAIGSSAASVSAAMPVFKIGELHWPFGFIANYSHIGYIDDLRITTGLARYTGATFTPPTSQLST